MPPSFSQRAAAYLDSLRRLPFVSDAQLGPRAASTRGPAHWVLEVTAHRVRRRFLVEEKRSHLGQALVNDVIARAPGRARLPVMLFAPYVSASMGARLVAHGINFVDLAGNCHVDLGGRYVGHVEGRRAGPVTTTSAGTRGPGLRLLFALLADPQLVDASARVVAGVAGVSIGTVSNVLRRLEHERLIVRTRSKRHLLGVRELLDRWLAGYGAALRSSLLLGRFQARERDPEALETRLEKALDESTAWGWGGGAAAWRLTRHYHGEDTILHIDGRPAPAELAVKLDAAPASSGRLIVLGVPTPSAFHGPQQHVVHPLLVYSELMLSGSDRAREAAAEVRARWLVDA